MKPLEITLAFAVLLVLLALSFGGGWLARGNRSALPDTVRTVEYVEVPVQVGTAKPKPVIRYVRDTVRIVVKDTLDGMLLSYADYDSLTVPRSWEIDGEHIGHMDLGYDPLARILSYTHTPPPMKIETVEIIREAPVSFWHKAEYLGYGLGCGIILGIAIAR